MAVRGTACADVSAEQTRSEIRYRAYDKAVLLAVKNSPYVRQEAASMDDYGYNVLAYRLADKALNDITVITVRDDNEKICLEVSGELDQEKTNAVLRTKQPEFNPANVAQIAEKIKRELPKSMYETDCFMLMILNIIMAVLLLLLPAKLPKNWLLSHGFL